MFCQFCGTVLNDTARFCKSCGAATGQDAPAQIPDQTALRINIGVSGAESNRKPIVIGAILAVIVVAGWIFWWVYKGRAATIAGNAGAANPAVTFPGPNVDTAGLLHWRHHG